jgi:hypothetical protein
MFFFENSTSHEPCWKTVKRTNSSGDLLTLQYASRGAKEFVNELAPVLKNEFPHVDLVVEPRNGRAPFLEGFYKNGRRKPIGIKVRVRYAP